MRSVRWMNYTEHFVYLIILTSCDSIKFLGTISNRKSSWRTIWTRKKFIQWTSSTPWSNTTSWDRENDDLMGDWRYRRGYGLVETMRILWIMIIWHLSVLSPLLALLRCVGSCPDSLIIFHFSVRPIWGRLGTVSGWMKSHYTMDDNNKTKNNKKSLMFHIWFQSTRYA